MVGYRLMLAAILSLAVSGARGDDVPASGDVAAFPRAEPEEVGIDNAALERLHARAKDADSDAVVIVKDGRLVADWDFGRPRGPIEAMSATKSIVNLAIGRLIDMGKITSIDQPVHEIYLEWKQGRKKLITIRHLLNHTSGIQDNRTTSEIYPSPDFVQLALAAELSDNPGTRFFYNNKAVNLLAGIVRRASGERMDVFIGKEIFGPMGIRDFGWSLDPAGNPHAMAGLQIRAIDLARIGQLMLDEGAWKGRQVVSKEWVRRSLEVGQAFEPTSGLLWWLDYGRPAKLMVDDTTVKYYKDMGMTPQSLEKLQALKGKAMEAQAILAALRPIVGPDPGLRSKVEVLRTMPPLKSTVEGPPRGFAAQGYAGQHLFVMPRHRLVAVRQRRRREGSNPDDPKGYFLEFMDLVAALVPDRPGR